MNSRKSLALAALAAAVALTATSVAPALGAPNTAPNRGRYAALGDSFAAGVGNTPLPGAGTSLRSADSYPVYLAGSPNKVTFLAASGATTADVMADQVPELPSGARQVTLTVGGNDLLFAQVALACAADINAPQCAQAISGSEAAQAELPSRVGTLLAAIRAQAPKATIYVTGYPRLFQPNVAALALGQAGEVCPALGAPGQFDPRALLFADEASDDLNAGLAQVVQTASAVDENIRFVDVSGDDGVFAGHGLCAAESAERWIYPPSFLNGMPSPSSLHPNVAGQHGYEQAVLEAGFVN